MKLSLPKIPILSTPDTALGASSWQHLPIADIADDIVLYRDGGAALVMEASSLNFSLLSTIEQEAVIASYAALINSLSFTIQIVVRSQKKDISSYIRYLEETTKNITNPLLSSLSKSYKEFILSAVKKKNVLGKKFYIVIPFSPLELGVAKSFVSTFKPVVGPLPFPKSYVIKKAKIILYPKRDHLLRQVGRFGIKLKQLTNLELVDLYYSIYNPEPPALKQEKTAEEIAAISKI